MFSRRKRRHISGLTELSSNSLVIPDVTADAEVRLERLSADSSTGTWHDITANSNNGTATTASTLADFYFNAAGVSANEMVDLTSVLSANDPTQTFTITFWAKNESAIDGNCIIMATRQDSDRSNGWKMQDFSSAPNPNYEWVTATVPAVNKGPVMPEGIGMGWAYLAFTWEPGTPNVVKGYKNGVLVGTVDPATFTASTQPLRLFRGTYQGNSWTGYCDTLRVYPRVLSVDEMVRDYNAGQTSHSVAVTTTNLVSQYMPSGQTASSWTDIAGSNNMTGAVTDPPAFDGNDYYTIGNPADLQFTNNWSVEAWASQSDQAPVGSAFERLISRDDVGGGNRCFILSQRDNDGFPFAGIFVGGALKSVTGSHDYADGNYHHYMVTHDGSNLRLYIDGSLEGSVATGGPMDNDSVNWEIGRAQDGSADLNTGRVDTVRFYNTTLTTNQIINNYQAGLPVHS